MRNSLFIFKNSRILITAIFLVNFSYIFIYKDRVFTIFIFAAMLFFTGLLRLVKRFGPEHDSLPWQGRAEPEVMRSFLFILPFFIPIIFCYFHQRIVFWNFNEIARVALAWLIFSLAWLNFSEARNKEIGIKGVAAPFLLFTVWAAVLWLGLIWDAGSKVIFLKAISSPAIVKTDRFASVIYKIWETKPLSEHFGLAFQDYSSFKESAYSHQNQFYLFINYVVLKFIQFLVDCKMEVATRLLPFFFSILLTVSVAAFFLKTKFDLQIRKISTQLTFFFGLGFLLSLPDFWITLLRYNTDNCYPWVSYITLILFAYICLNDYKSKGFVFLLYFYCLLVPFYAVISLFTYVFFVFALEGARKDKLLFRRTIMILGVGLTLAVVSLMCPYFLIKILKYKEVGSSLLFRSGLDGDMTYYDNIWQAVVSPYNKSLIRPWSGFISVMMFCTIAFIFAGLKKYKKGSVELMNSIFLFSPYLFSVVFFPQAVSIHPYLYDYLLLFPVAFLGVYWLCSQEFHEKMKGPWLYLVFLFMTGFVIYNLTKIAQAASNLTF